MKRLQIQALLFESSAKNSLIKAGLRPGMKCMDVGCGIGNVSKLMSDMVGNKGIVLGTDIEKKYVRMKQDVYEHLAKTFLDKKDKKSFH